MELYRYLIDDFLIEYCRNLRTKDFIVKAEPIGRKKQGKREYLSNPQTNSLMNQLNAFLESKLEIPRIRVGKSQTVETLINEEALLLATYLRNERETWSPRIAIPN